MRWFGNGTRLSLNPNQSQDEMPGRPVSASGFGLSCAELGRRPAWPLSTDTSGQLRLMQVGPDPACGIEAGPASPSAMPSKLVA